MIDHYSESSSSCKQIDFSSFVNRGYTTIYLYIMSINEMKLVPLGIICTSLTLSLVQPKTTVLSIQCWLEICGNSNEFTRWMYRLSHEKCVSTLNSGQEHFPWCNPFGCRVSGQSIDAINLVGKFLYVGNIKHFFLNTITIKFNSSSEVRFFATVSTIQDVMHKILCRD